ncbi:MAG TPA: His/Gly/Thr/Pro-type tRNA ligase C-terminal domain-containing protein, partial [Planctomycetota bacterium]|nr:His/Gly/Thr/Pro-type tRNA ligase C-terminal domain-containing protein [Planctomycetota bacterium]
VPPAEWEKWFDYWREARFRWYVELGIDAANLRRRDHEATELAHYSNATTDIEYRFPIGWKELEGVASRTDFDLKRHSEASGRQLEYFDGQTRERFMPWVIEPAAGVDRALLAFLADAYEEQNVAGAESAAPASATAAGALLAGAVASADAPFAGAGAGAASLGGGGGTGGDAGESGAAGKAGSAGRNGGAAKGGKDEDDIRTVLHLHPRLAPIKVAIFPLVKKEGMPEFANKLEEELRARGVSTFYDQSGAIGRRYRRQDEIGTPWCVTVDGESLAGGSVTLRDRDSMRQERVAATSLAALIAGKLGA